ncbi:MAG: flagellar basal body P-ring formation protein FlgA, partial [Planctomycetes bacterium]|nr:flagellar basal body P-ring formation protein FlgA [Planctomycetota bacterium]
VKLAAKISKSSSSKLPNRIWVGVMEDGAEIGGREIVFKVKFKQQRVVALADIAEGAMIGSDNVRIETIEADRPLAKDWSVPYGMVARRRINKDSVITETMVRAVAPPILIERGQMVVIKIERPGMMISALGEAMGDGKVGDYIKIKRGFERDSPLIVGRVKPDGTVEPVY